MSSLSNAVSSLLTASDESWRWQAHLQAASFRGVPFGVLNADGEFGRTLAIHDYPYRDNMWAEDLGQSTRRFTLEGFIVQGSRLYTASDVMTQRDSLIAACETSGAGTLVHPTLGELTVSVPAGGLHIREGLAHGRVFYFTLACVESGLKVFAITAATPASSTLSTSFQSTLSTAATLVVAEITAALQTVTQAMKTAKSTLSVWCAQVEDSVNAVTHLQNMLSATFGSTVYGRYCNGTVGGNCSGASARTTVAEDTADYDGLVAEKIAALAQCRTALSEALETVTGTAAIADIPVNVQAALDAIIDAVPSAGDRMSVLAALTDFSDDTSYASDSDTAVQSVITVYVNGCAASALAYAASSYSPSSYDDAVAALSRVTDAMDAAALQAADAGYDALYAGLQRQRQAIMTVMQAAGAALSPVKTFTFPQPLPALTLANRLYQDATRADGLVKSANPVHPAFMPVSFKALAS